jgi:hypothetical protein
MTVVLLSTATVADLSSVFFEVNGFDDFEVVWGLLVSHLLISQVESACFGILTGGSDQHTTSYKRLFRTSRVMGAKEKCQFQSAASRKPSFLLMYHSGSYLSRRTLMHCRFVTQNPRSDYI